MSDLRALRIIKQLCTKYKFQPNVDYGLINYEEEQLLDIISNLFEELKYGTLEIDEEEAFDVDSDEEDCFEKEEDDDLLYDPAEDSSHKVDSRGIGSKYSQDKIKKIYRMYQDTHKPQQIMKKFKLDTIGKVKAIIHYVESGGSESEKFDSS